MKTKISLSGVILRELLIASMFLLDYGQTRTIAVANDNPTFEWREINPILGPYPSESAIDNYFAIGTAAHIAVTAMLPMRYRAIWQSVTIVLEGIVLAHNVRNGIPVSL